MAAALLVTDTRTSKKYEIPIHNNAIEATEFAKIMTPNTSNEAAGHVSTGLRIIDEGLRNTAVMQSSITKLDGNLGMIRYRDYSIDELFERYDYEDVAFLLIWGHLPKPFEKNTFRFSLVALMAPPPEVLMVVDAFPRTVPAFTIITAALSAWNATQPEHIPSSKGTAMHSPQDIGAVDGGIVRTLAAVATCAALACCHKKRVDFTSPDPTGSFASNLLLMCGIVDTRDGKPSDEHARLLSKLMILYADHEMTNSTAAYLHVASTLADPLSCAIAAICAGNGPLHGGALQVAYRQFAEIGSVDNVSAFLDRVRKGETRIFGFGHRIWRATDPRYKFVYQLLESEALRDSFRNDQLLAVAMEIERQASLDEHFQKKRIRPNVDLIGCFVFNALGFTPDVVVSFASVARMAGAVAHWREQMQRPINIWRPQAIFVEPGRAEIRGEAPIGLVGKTRARL